MKDTTEGKKIVSEGLSAPSETSLDGYSHSPGLADTAQEPSTNHLTLKPIVCQGVVRYIVPKAIDPDTKKPYVCGKLRDLVDTMRGISGVKKGILSSVLGHYPMIWPAVPMIADESGFGTTAVKEALRFWESQGALVSLGSGKGGRNKSTQYRAIESRILEMSKNCKKPDATRLRTLKAEPFRK
jgi:hypothetical protein